MYQTGALIVHSSKVLLPALAAASKLVSQVLYVPLAYTTTNGGGSASSSRTGSPGSDTNPQQDGRGLSETLQEIRSVYFQASRQCPLLDVRILLPKHPVSPSTGTGMHPARFNPDSIPLQHGNLDVLLSSIPSLEEVKRLPGYLLLAKRIQSDTETTFEEIKCESITTTTLDKTTPPNSDPSPLTTFSDVALGGTFDNLHNGHRLLLTEGALLASRRILVGVSTGPLLDNKALPELIKPAEVGVVFCVCVWR